jgi:hypothetical protein
MVLDSASQPQLVPLPTSADYSLEQELAGFVPPYTTKSYGEPPFPPPLPKDIWDDWLKANPQYATQTMSTTDPATHHFGQTSTGNYEADLARMKEDMTDMLKDKLGFISCKSRLYHRPHVDTFDSLPHWFPILSSLEVMITGPLGSISANISLNLGKLVLASLCTFVCFLYL